MNSSPIHDKPRGNQAGGQGHRHQVRLMTTEYQVLLALAFLYWALGHVAIPTKTRLAGLAWNVGNRDHNPEFPAWVQRADRAQRNLLESLPLYFALAIVLHAQGISNPLTQLGAWLFLGSRLAHATLYIAGITGLRTLAYGLSLLALALMASSLI